MIPLSEGEFAVGNPGRRYVFDDAGRSGFRIEDWQYTDHRFEPVEPWEPNAADMEALSGTYHSEDAETTYVIRVDDGDLTAWQRPNRTPEAGAYLRRRISHGPKYRSLSSRRHRSHQRRVPELGRVYDMRFQRVEKK